MPFEISINEQQEYPIITLKNTHTGCEAEIYAFGGLLNAFRIPVKNEPLNVVEAFSSVADAKKNITNGFKSAKLSPFVCRMHMGNYRLGNKSYKVNKHFLGQHAIHGLVYDATYRIVNSEKTATSATVGLEYQYKGTDVGYPFPFTITLHWKLENAIPAGNKLTVTTTVAHQNPFPIPFADGWHPYFTLGGEVDNWTLQFNSQTQLEFNDALLPTGKKIPDTRFIDATSLQDIILDNSFEFEDPLNKKSTCTLSNGTFRLTVEPDASYPILQLYTPPGRKSIAIENLSGAPDNFNNGIFLLMLPPGKPKTFSTSYTIDVL